MQCCLLDSIFFCFFYVKLFVYNELYFGNIIFNIGNDPHAKSTSLDLPLKFWLAEHKLNS